MLWDRAEGGGMERERAWLVHVASTSTPGAAGWGAREREPARAASWPGIGKRSKPPPRERQWAVPFIARMKRENA